MKTLLKNHVFNIVTTLVILFTTLVALREETPLEYIAYITAGFLMAWFCFLVLPKSAPVVDKLLIGLILGCLFGVFVWIVGNNSPVVAYMAVGITLTGVMLAFHYREPRYDAKGEILGALGGIASGVTIFFICSAWWVALMVAGIVLAVVNYTTQEASRALALEDALN
jgi:Na+/melibiose symporter-like transporter